MKFLDWCKINNKEYLVDEWYSDENGADISIITHSTKTIVKWKCRYCNNVWEAPVKARTSCNHQCPKCCRVQGRKKQLLAVAESGNNLLISNPELAKEWHPTKNGELTPSMVTPFSNKKVWWYGKCNHEWEASINSRNKGINCPYCSNKKVLVGFNDLQFCNPRLAKEWHPTLNGDLTPEQVTPKSGKVVWWKCSNCGYEWQKEIHTVAKGWHCPNCSRTRFYENHPDLVAEWDYEKNSDIDIKSLTEHNGKKVWWICKTCGNSYQAKIADRVYGSGCRKCLDKKTSIRRSTPKNGKDLLSVHPDIAAEWNYDKNEKNPSEYTYASAEIVWWKCPKGHEWKAAINNRTISNSGCPYCSGRLPIKGETDLASQRPYLLKEWHPTKNGSLLPDAVSCGSSLKVWWICPKGHEWQAQVVNRSNQHQGCPECTAEFKTSLPEKEVYYYIKKYYPSALDNYKDKWLGRKELDIFIPEYKIAIEYDGGHWHKDVLKDIEKDTLCINNGVTLFRIRDVKCPIYESKSIIVPYNKNIDDFQVIIIKLLNLIAEITGYNYDYDIDIDRDLNDIIMSFLTLEKKVSVATSDLINEWDYEKNENLDPKYFSLNSRVDVWWRCKDCGYGWKKQIVSRYKGSSCPRCKVVNPLQIEFDFDN